MPAGVSCPPIDRPPRPDMTFNNNQLIVIPEARKAEVESLIDFGSSRGIIGGSPAAFYVGWLVRYRCTLPVPYPIL